jgi:hypothetical protein
MTGERKRILIVDDSPLLLDLAKEALERAGFTVLVTQDFRQLGSLQQHGRIDLILMDVQMPELFGDDVAAVLREVRGVKTPIYLLSSLPRRCWCACRCHWTLETRECAPRRLGSRGRATPCRSPPRTGRRGPLPCRGATH